MAFQDAVIVLAAERGKRWAELARLPRMASLECLFDLVDLRGIELQRVRRRDETGFDRFGQMTVDGRDFDFALGRNRLRVETALVRSERGIDRRR